MLMVFNIETLPTVHCIIISYNSQKSMEDLTFSLDTVVKTSVRKTVTAGRYLDELKEKGEIEFPGECLCIIKCGDIAIAGGQGEIFETSIATKTLSSLFNSEDVFRSVFNPQYDSSKLQILRFDQCFKKLPHDARGGKFEQFFV